MAPLSSDASLDSSGPPPTRSSPTAAVRLPTVGQVQRVPGRRDTATHHWRRSPVIQMVGAPAPDVDRVVRVGTARAPTWPLQMVTTTLSAQQREPDPASANSPTARLPPPSGDVGLAMMRTGTMRPGEPRRVRLHLPPGSSHGPSGRVDDLRHVAPRFRAGEVWL